MSDQRSAGSGRLRFRYRRLRRSFGREGNRRAFRRSYRLLFIGGPLSTVPCDSHYSPTRCCLSRHHRRCSTSGGCLHRQSDRKDFSGSYPSSHAAGGSRSLDANRRCRSQHCSGQYSHRLRRSGTQGGQLTLGGRTDDV